MTATRWGQGDALEMERSIAIPNLLGVKPRDDAK